MKKTNKEDPYNIPTGTDIVEGQLDKLMENFEISVSQIRQYNDVAINDIVESHVKMGVINGMQARVLLGHYKNELWKSQRING